MSENYEAPNSNKAAFKIGILSTVAVAFVVGFFVLLVQVTSQGAEDSGRISATASRNGNGQAAPSHGGAAMANPSDTKLDVSQDWVKGDPNAPISIVEYSDLECPFCKRLHNTLSQVVDNYDGEVNWVFRHFPLHRRSQKEAEATECAGVQGGNEAFWAYTDRLFEITRSNDSLAANKLPEIADYVGLDVNEFNECLNSGRQAQPVKDDLAKARAAGGRGTPYSVIVVGGRSLPVSGALPYERFKSTLDSLLN